MGIPITGPGRRLHPAHQLQRLDLQALRQPRHRRDPQVASATLVATDLQRVHAATMREIFLAPSPPFAELLDVAADDGFRLHAPDKLTALAKSV